MPTYEYECKACKHRFEELQSFSEAPLKKCPACKKKKLQRLLGVGAAIIFKGSGFYQTDYRSESYKSAAKADQTAPTTEKTGTDATTTKADTKDTPGASTPKEPKTPPKKAKS
ncbi:MAG: zinc ribbon domain-containing protein [Planctomycetes bacterium]|nr:zinc ribbon domain-containing protein [Planctomycetota bacterium]